MRNVSSSSPATGFSVNQSVTLLPSKNATAQLARLTGFPPNDPFTRHLSWALAAAAERNSTKLRQETMVRTRMETLLWERCYRGRSGPSARLDDARLPVEGRRALNGLAMLEHDQLGEPRPGKRREESAEVRIDVQESDGRGFQPRSDLLPRLAAVRALEDSAGSLRDGRLGADVHPRRVGRIDPERADGGENGDRREGP